MNESQKCHCVFKVSCWEKEEMNYLLYNCLPSDRAVTSSVVTFDRDVYSLMAYTRLRRCLLWAIVSVSPSAHNTEEAWCLLRPVTRWCETWVWFMHYPTAQYYCRSISNREKCQSVKGKYWAGTENILRAWNWSTYWFVFTLFSSVFDGHSLTEHYLGRTKIISCQVENQEHQYFLFWIEIFLNDYFFMNTFLPFKSAFHTDQVS